MHALRGFGLATGIAAWSAAASAGSLYISDYQSGLVDEYTTAGALVGTFINTGGAGAAGLHFGPDGNLYVANFQGGGIKVYDGSTGAYLRTFATGSFLDFTFDAAGRLYAVDNNSVLKYDAAGNLLAAYSGGVSTPQGITLAVDGHLPVSNTYSGTYRNTITSLDPSSGTFTTFATGLGEPVGIAPGPDGRYYVANYAYASLYGGTNGDTIQVIAATGGVSSTWNSGGSLWGTSYLAFAGSQLFVTSYYNGMVQVFDAATGVATGAFNVGPGPQGIAYRLAPVPEPATLLLWATGAAFITLRRHRHRH